jgi:hypothetical protein
MKRIFLALIVGVIVASSVIISNPAIAAPLTTTFVQPSNNFPFKGATYAIGFTTATTGTIGIIDIDFPVGTGIPVIQVADRSGIGTGTTVALDLDTARYTITAPVSVPANTQIYLLLAKIQNSETAPLPHNVIITTRTSTGVIIDGPTIAPFNLTNRMSGNNMLGDALGNVGIGNLSPTEKLQVEGNIRLSGTARSIMSDSTLKIVPATGDVCIGSGC